MLTSLKDKCLCDGVQFGGGHIHEHVVESVLPLVAVGDGGHLEWRAVQQDEFLVGDGIHLLHFIAHLDVLRDGLVKV